MSIKNNVIANYIGQGWVALASIAFVPIYVSKLGIEAYGLIGIYTVLQVWLSLLDLGITPTITREMSKLKSGQHTSTSIHNLIFSFEVIVYLISISVLLILLMSSSFISEHWLNSNIQSTTLNYAIQVASFVIASRFCEGIYRGGLIGLEQHVLFNKLQIILSTLKYGGAALVVTFSPSIVLFFSWQAAISIITVICLRYALVHSIPSDNKVPKFSISELKKIRKFAGGMTLTNLIALMFTQTDKFLVSKFESLESFGYYMLSFTIAGILPMLTYPIASSISPKLNAAVSLGNKSDELFLFNTGNQIVTIIATPLFAACLLFSYQIVFSWTNDAALSNTTGKLLSLIIIGAYCNTLLLIPFTLQQSHGWTTLSISTNLIGLLILFPSVYWGLKLNGVWGAALAWAFCNIIILILATLKMHQKLLQKELKSFLLDTILKPVVVCIAIAIPTSLFFQNLGQSRLSSLVGIMIYTVSAAVMITATLPIKKEVINTLKNVFKK
jgi:O-antigen/teichoic acid export membrane protein